MARASSVRTILAVSGLGLAVLIAVVFARALMLESRQLVVEPGDLPEVDAATVAAHLAGAIRHRTVSDQEATAQAQAASREQLAALHDYLVATYPRVHARLEREVVAGHSLLYTWAGRDRSLPPMLLAAHMDVVPAGDAEWTHPPFAGAVDAHYVWGRGAIDDKLGVIAILEAVEHLLGRGFEPTRTVHLAFGHDEESGGTGAAAIAEVLRARAVTLDMVLDEGLPITVGIVPGVAPDVALIAVAEKGYATVQVSVETAGGHSSAPPRQTAIGIAAAAVAAIESHPFPARRSGVALDMFQWLAPEGSFALRLVFANEWLLWPAIESLLAQSPDTDALIRTTTAVTLIEGGEKENVLPRSARALVNFRIIPGEDPEDVVQHVREAIADDRVNVGLAGHAWGSGAPSPVGSAQFDRVHRAVRRAYPGTVVAPGLMLAATDARSYAPLTENVFRFTPAPVTAKDVPRIHGLDERVALDALQRSVRFYAAVLSE
jgi:carboxypeptidase PM20D1